MTRSPRVRNASLAAEMARQGFNNRSLSEASDVSSQCLSAALNLRVQPNAETKRKIARALGVKIADIFPSEVVR